MTSASRLRALRVAAPLLRSHLCLGGRHRALPVWPRLAPSAFVKAEHWRRSFSSDSKKAKAPETSGADNVEKASETGVPSGENAASSKPSDEAAKPDPKAAAPSEAPAEKVSAAKPMKAEAASSEPFDEAASSDAKAEAAAPSKAAAEEVAAAEPMKAEVASSEPSDEAASSDAKAEAAAPSEAPAEEVAAAEPMKAEAASSEASDEAAPPSEAAAEEVAAAEPMKAEAASSEPSDEAASSDAKAEVAAAASQKAEAASSERSDEASSSDAKAEVAAVASQKAEAASSERSDEAASSEAKAEAAPPSEAAAEEVAAAEPMKAEAASSEPSDEAASSDAKTEAAAAAASEKAEAASSEPSDEDSAERDAADSQEADGQEEAEAPGSPGGLIGRHLHRSTDLPPASWRHAGEWVDLELERAGIPSEVCDGLPSNWGRSSDFESEPEPNVMWPHPTLHDHRSRPFVRPRSPPGEESESGAEVDDRRLKENRRRLEALWKLSNSHGISWDELDAAFVAFAKSGKQRHAQWSRAPGTEIAKFRQELEALDPKNVLVGGMIRAGKEYGHPMPIAGHMKRYCEARARAYLQPFCPKVTEDGTEREDPRRCYPSQLRRLTSRLYRQEKRKFFAPWRPGKLSQKLQQLVAARMLRRETNERVYGFEKRT